MLFLACRLSSCRSCRSVLVALAQLEVADNSSSTHTTTTQLQLVTQGKDAVIGSSLVALVVLAQRGKKRSVQCNSFCFGDLSPTWKEAAEADIAEDSATTTNTTIPTSHGQLRLVIYICFAQLWRCKNLLMVGVPAVRRTARRSTDRCARLKWPQTKMRGKWRKQQLSPVLSLSQARSSGKFRTASWTLAVPWHLWTCCRSMCS